MFLKAARSIIASCLMAASVVAALPARAETLADALASAYRNSNLIEQNRAVLRAADEDVAGAVAKLRPVLQWVADWDWTDTPAGRSSTASLALQAQMTLFDFGRNQLGIQVAEQAVLATRQALVSVEQDVLLSAVSAYFGLRSALENVAINENSVRVLNETLRATRDQFEVGEVTRTDVALAEARLAAARAALAAARGQLAVARETYKAATGHYPGPLAGAPRPPALPATLAEAQKIAQRSHPAILQAQYQAKAADLGVSLAAAQRRPSLTGSAGISLTEGGTEAAALGLSLSQTIYSGGALASAQRKAVANREAARAALLQASVNVSRNVAATWADIEVARAQINATEQQVQAAQIAYDGVREEAKLGARTTLDVLDAEQSLLDARANRIQAQANLQVAYYALLASMGLLTAENLGLNVPIYDPEAYYNAVRSAPATSIQGDSLDRVLKAIGKN